jgi:tRNA C32,U32 (ribose-2'-O)-methylase TrmJ
VVAAVIQTMTAASALRVLTYAHQTARAEISQKQRTGRSRMTAPDPTFAELKAMIAECRTAYRATAYAAADERKVHRRYTNAYDAILAARPSEPAAMALQLRWLMRERGIGGPERGILMNIARRLEAMAAD